MKINLKTRFQNPVFLASVLMSILTPILMYFGLTVEDMTTWKGLGEILFQAICNPYVCGMVVVNLYNTIIDPTTKGIGDSQLVLDRDKENK